MSKKAGNLSVYRPSSRLDDFVASPTTRAWLTQFEPDDLTTAIELLRELKLVSADHFAQALTKLIFSASDECRAPIALYVEREIHSSHGRPDRLFTETPGKVKRATGAGPPVIKPTRAYDPKVGSEGVVAHIVSQVSKIRPSLCLLSPGPDLIRSAGVRRFVVVTDLIASGSRTSTFLTSAWRVRSVRSWWSARNNRGLSFEVIAFASTKAGEARLLEHPSRPVIRIADSCPTIGDLLDKQAVERLTQLCEKYAPPMPRKMPALGYGNIGALLAFAHGIPNNAPTLLYGRGKRWSPLFPERVTTDLTASFGRQITPQDVSDRLGKLGQKRLSKSQHIFGKGKDRRESILVLGSLGRSPRFDVALAGRTGLEIATVQRLIAHATVNGLVNVDRRLTAAGQAELAAARRSSVRPKRKLSFNSAESYYPTELRAPAKASS